MEKLETNGEFPKILPIGISSLPVSLSSLTEVDANGLPKIPFSVACYARLQYLCRIKHPNLAQYLDAIREKLEIILIVSEYYVRNLSCIVDPVDDISWVCKRMSETLSALYYMEGEGLVHSFITPKSIMLDLNGCVKLSGYGIYFASGWGDAIDYPLVHHIYSAPEAFLTVLSENINSEEFCYIGVPPLKIESDLWSVGLIFFELLHGKQKANPLHQIRSKKEVIQCILRGLYDGKHGKNLPEYLEVAIEVDKSNVNLCSIDLMLRSCMRFNATLRPKLQTLIKELEEIINKTNDIVYKHSVQIAPDYSNQNVKCSGNNNANLTDTAEIERLKSREFISNISDLSELYYYWRLAGGKPNMIAKTKNNFDSEIDLYTENSSSQDFPILKIPHYLAVMKSDSSRMIYSKELWPSNQSIEQRIYNNEFIPLPNHRLIERITRISVNTLYPIIITPNLYSFQFEKKSSLTEKMLPDAENRCVTDVGISNNNNNNNHNNFLNLLFTDPSVKEMKCNSIKFDYKHYKDLILKQPLSVRETDVDYQIHRVRLFTRLLRGVPATKHIIRIEARKDIPPFLRSKIWAVLLDVDDDHEFEANYFKILHSLSSTVAKSSMNSNSVNLNYDKETELDEKVINQISVDLPRCHGYDGILASPLGQCILRRVLAVTLLMKPGALDYTQGMDSVTAVFVRLCFPDEVLATVCLRSFLIKKLPGFFSYSGLTFNLKSFFSVLLRLFAFHLPLLAHHLVNLNVPLIGLTTGWIYTLFAHTMPLDRVELLWDTIIVGPPSLSMFFYISVFFQLNQAINFERLGLEQICTILSSFPEVNLDKCRVDALRFALATPKSLTFWCTSSLNDELVQKRNDESKNDSSVDENQTNETTVSRKNYYLFDNFLTSRNINSDGDNFNFDTITTPAPNHFRDANDRNKFERSKSSEFYEHLTKPGGWPEHLEFEPDKIDSLMTEEFRIPELNKTTLNRNDCDLVPLINMHDALVHLNRPDCFILDIRNQTDYLKGHIINSVCREPSQIIELLSVESETDVGNRSSSRINLNLNTSHEDWEIVDYANGSGSRNHTLLIFLEALMAEPEWIKAVEARRVATKLQQQTQEQQQKSNNNESSNPCTPGLILIYGCDQKLCWQLCHWFIRCDIDRVCLFIDGLTVLNTNPQLVVLSHFEKKANR